MKNYILGPDAIVMVSGSSAGTQPKFYENGYWYKANNKGYEGLSEYLAGILLSCSNVDSYVKYEECTINGKKGCRSKNFLNDSETFVSLQRLFDIYHGGNLLETILPMNKVEDRIKYVKEFVYEYTDLDISEYLSQILTLDYIILNTDRHFHNLGIIIDSSTKKYKCAPIFDNGNSLLSDYELFPAELSIEENIEKVYGQPFSSNLGIQASAAGLGLKIDKEKLNRLLDKEPDSRALEVLIYRIDHFNKL